MKVSRAKCSQGELEGRDKGAHQVYLRIPFAKAEKRFALAEPVEQWDGVLDATKAPEQPPQKVAPFVSGPTPVSEDCLFLNVYTPKADTKARTVMVWFYGGGFTQGTSYNGLYNGKYLAERGDVVVVTVNYRVGLLGYGYLEHVKGDAIDTVPNIGLHDQLEALRWVQKNIANFGGDANQVTLFGQSAGAMSICAMLACPQAEGLFKRAICQSGGDALISSTEAVEEINNAALKKIGVDSSNISDLHAMPHEKMIKGPKGLLHLAYDTELLPERPIQALKENRGRKVDLMMGYTQHEVAIPLVREKLGFIGKIIGMLGPKGLHDTYESIHKVDLLSDQVRTNMDEVIEFYQQFYIDKGEQKSEAEICTDILTDAIFAVPTRQFLNAHSQSNADVDTNVSTNVNTCVNTYAFRFNWGVSILGKSNPISFHACDVPFPFGTINDLKSSFKWLMGVNQQTHDLSDNVLDAWLNFAKTGNPQHQKLDKWEAYSTENQGFMVFDNKSEYQESERGEIFAFWDRFLGPEGASTVG